MKQDFVELYHHFTTTSADSMLQCLTVFNTVISLCQTPKRQWRHWLGVRLGIERSRVWLPARRHCWTVI